MRASQNKTATCVALRSDGTYIAAHKSHESHKSHRSHPVAAPQFPVSFFLRLLPKRPPKKVSLIALRTGDKKCLLDQNVETAE